jgi:hypothetical protein
VFRVIVVCCRTRIRDGKIVEGAVAQVIKTENASRDHRVVHDVLCNMMPQAMVEALLLLIKGCQQLAEEEEEVSRHKQARLKEFKVPDKYARVPMCAYLMTASKLLECCAKDTYVSDRVFVVQVVDVCVCVCRITLTCVSSTSDSWTPWSRRRCTASGGRMKTSVRRWRSWPPARWHHPIRPLSPPLEHVRRTLQLLRRLLLACHR